MVNHFKIMWRLVYGLLTAAETILATSALIVVFLFVFACVAVEAGFCCYHTRNTTAITPPTTTTTTPTTTTTAAGAATTPTTTTISPLITT